MPPKVLREYQGESLERVTRVINLKRHPLVVLPTGGGKTVVFCRLVSVSRVPTVLIAHRKELLAQISRGLASEGVEHSIIAPDATVRMISVNNANSFQRSWVHTGARVTVASVDSLKRVDSKWAATIEIVIIDEGHHALENNKWGHAAAHFVNASITGWTATAERGDGKGLGRDYDGLYTDLVIGPSTRDLITQESLSEYVIYACETAGLDLAKVPIGKTGDYSQPTLRKVMASSDILGDVVEHYKRLAPGKRGLTFVVDVQAAHDMALAYRDAGVPAEVVSANTKPAERAQIIRKFAEGKILQIVNVDLLFEGFDLAAAAGMDVCVDVISMARPTHSFVLFSQMFGRVLRVTQNGPRRRAIIIDHVGNVIRHNGPPDFARPISLAPKARRSRSSPEDVPVVRQCGHCGAIHLKELGNCPECGFEYKPAERSTPAEVDGDLTMLDDAVLAELREKAAIAVWGPKKAHEYYSQKFLPDIGVAANVRRARELLAAQTELRESMAVVLGQWRGEGLNDSSNLVRFYLKFGIDVATAGGLKKAEAEALNERIRDYTR